MKIKSLSIVLGLAVIVFCTGTSTAEARHCRSHSNFSLNLVAPQPAPYVIQEQYVVEQYQPYYGEPVYVQPQPYRRPVVYVQPRPIYRQVVVCPRPVPHTGVSFSWFFGR